MKYQADALMVEDARSDRINAVHCINSNNSWPIHPLCSIGVCGNHTGNGSSLQEQRNLKVQWNGLEIGSIDI